MKYNGIFEVETRLYFKNKQESFNIFPFLKSCLNLKVKWRTDHYGIKLFQDDIIIRISQVNINGEKLFSLGYKEPDIGGLINIRKEYEEQIKDGINYSQILYSLGGKKIYNSIS